MNEVKVKLKDPTKIAWDRETGAVITGPDEFTVEETMFIRKKLAEGELVRADAEPEPVKPGKRKKDQFYQGVG